MAGGERIWIVVGGERYSLHAWAVVNGKNPYTVLRRYRRGITDPFEMLETRPRKPEETPRKREDMLPEYTPEDLTEREIAALKKIAYASEGQKDHWRIMCDLAGVKYKYANRLKEVLGDN